jgi:hypothetical protein
VNGKIRYEPKELSKGLTDSDRNVQLGDKAFRSPAWLAAVIVHEATHANQFKEYPTRQRIYTNEAAAELMSYQSAMRYADELGLSEQERLEHLKKIDECRGKMGEAFLEKYRDGQYHYHILL